MLIIFNFMLFVTDALRAGGHPRWWVWPAGITVMFIVAFFYVQQWKTDGKGSWATMASYEFVFFNLLMFSAWLEARATAPFPWFLVPLCVSSIPLTVIYMRCMYHEYRVWTYIVAGIAELSFLVFLIWGFVNSAWPWFIVVWLVALVAMFVVWFTQRNKTGIPYEEVRDETFVPRPMPDGTQSNYQQIM